MFFSDLEYNTLLYKPNSIFLHYFLISKLPQCNDLFNLLPALGMSSTPFRAASSPQKRAYSLLKGYASQSQGRLEIMFHFWSLWDLNHSLQLATMFSIQHSYRCLIMISHLKLLVTYDRIYYIQHQLFIHTLNPSRHLQNFNVCHLRICTV